MRKLIGVMIVCLGVGAVWGADEVNPGAVVLKDATETQRETVKSEVVVVKGLGVGVEVVKKEFLPAEPLVVRLTYKNMGKDAMRLLDLPGNYGDWRLMLEEVKTGKKFTGHVVGSARVAATVGPGPGVVLKGGESVTAKTQLLRFGFVEGDWDKEHFAAAGAAYEPPAGEPVTGRGTGGSGPVPGGLNVNIPGLPEGVYKMRVEIRMVENAAGAVQARAADEKADGITTWTSDLIVTEPVVVGISRKALPLSVTPEDKQNAREAMALIKAWQEKDTELLQEDPAVQTIWRRVGGAAQGVVDDDGLDPELSARRLASFGMTMRQGVALARIATRRAGITQAAKDEALQIQDKLQELADR